MKGKVNAHKMSESSPESLWVRVYLGYHWGQQTLVPLNPKHTLCRIQRCWRLQPCFIVLCFTRNSYQSQNVGSALTRTEVMHYGSRTEWLICAFLVRMKPSLPSYTKQFVFNSQCLLFSLLCNIVVFSNHWSMSWAPGSWLLYRSHESCMLQACFEWGFLEETPSQLTLERFQLLVLRDIASALERQDVSGNWS